MTERICGWCGEVIPSTKRRDALVCKQSCRQKLHRFGVAPAGSKAVHPMRFAFADPPYPGFAEKYYGRPEVDHVELISMLVRQFPDGWALSTSSKTLIEVAAIIHRIVGNNDRVAIGSWHKGSVPGISMRARDAWEPLIVVGGRPRRMEGNEMLDNTLVLSTNARQRTTPGSLVGMKTGAFCEWMFRMLGALQGDTLVDIFPGSGTVGKAWDRFTREPNRNDARVTKPSRLRTAQK